VKEGQASERGTYGKERLAKREQETMTYDETRNMKCGQKDRYLK
jgi:hypothetical protein